MVHFSAQWFLAIYVSLGALLIGSGLYLMVRTDKTATRLTEAARQEKPPSSWKSVLKYLFLFTIPGLVLSFFPFSWIELLFSVLCLAMIDFGGQFTVLWKPTSAAILSTGGPLNGEIPFAALAPLSTGVILFLLSGTML